MKFDHQRAVSLRAVESYLLDELSPALRDEFEDHFFECPECAEALRAGLILQQNGRALLRAEPQLAVAAGVTGNQAEERPGTEVWWLAWLRIPSLLPMAATVFLVGVLYFRAGVDGETPVMGVKPVRLVAQSRGFETSAVFVSGIVQPVILDVRIDGSYHWTVRLAQKGGTAFQGNADSLRGEVTLLLDTRKLEPGPYEISLVPGSRDSSAEEKLYSFTLKRTP